MKTLAHDRDAAELLTRLRTLRPDSARRWGRMSVEQMVCHLCDGYRIVTGELRCAPVATPLPRPVMKRVALYAPVRWPQGIPTTPELDQSVGGTVPADFAADVAHLERLLTKVAAERNGRIEGLVHPIFGGMSEPAWLRWGYLHADHHFRQFGV